jgi:hypothetical protein
VKTTSNGRRPSMEDNLQWKTNSNGRRPPIEDDLKILNVEYLNNTDKGGPNRNRKLLKMKTTSNGRKKVKVEYLNNLLFDFSQILS